MLRQPERREEMVRGFQEVRGLLQAGDSMSNAAEVLLGLLRERSSRDESGGVVDSLQDPATADSTWIPVPSLS